MTALTILAVIGLPIVGMLAWSYEITPGGIVLDSGDTARGAAAEGAPGDCAVAGGRRGADGGRHGLAWWRSIAQAVEADAARRPATRARSRSRCCRSWT